MVPYEDGTAVFVSIGGWDGKGDADTAGDILGQLQTDLGYALALGLEECTGEEGGLLLHNRAKRKLTWDFEAAWTGAGWVVPGVCTWRGQRKRQRASRHAKRWHVFSSAVVFFYMHASQPSQSQSSKCS